MQSTAVSSLTEPVTMRSGTSGARSRARERAAIPSNRGEGVFGEDDVGAIALQPWRNASGCPPGGVERHHAAGS
jgi:hypothetical protein